MLWMPHRSLSDLDLMPILRAQVPAAFDLDALDQAYPISVDLGEGRGRAAIQ